jgi:hypothetical protein
MVHRYGYLPYRYGHPPYRYGIWANDMGDDSIDMIISHIDMGYIVTLPAAARWCAAAPRSESARAPLPACMLVGLS